MRRRRLRWTVAGRAYGAAWLLILAILPTCAQAAANGSYRIAGTVVNASTGQPVQGAMVAVLTVEDSHTVASTESGNNGRFVFSNLPAAKFQLTASKRGYCTSFYDQHGDFNSAIVTGEGQETGNLVFRLTPAAVVSGVVMGDGGDPVEGAAVMLFKKPSGHDPGAKIAQAATSVTDDTGAYEFANLTAGEYLLAVQARPWYALNHFSPGLQEQPETEQQAALDVAYPATFFDSTTDEGSATPIVLTAGSRQEANINMHAVPALHLEVEAARGEDGRSAVAHLGQSIFGVQVSNTTISSSGNIEFGGLAPGQYELTQGDPPRIAEIDATSSEQVAPDAGVSTAAINGMVEDSHGTPVTNASITLSPVDGNQGRTMTPTSFDRGSFSFRAVPAGRWALHVQSEEALLPVISMAIGSQRLAGNQFLVQDRPLSLAVTVNEAKTQVEGFARKAGKGFAGAMVVLVPKDLTAMAELARRDQSDSDGSFALRNVAPGEYTVLAIEDGWNLDWANPAVMERYLPAGKAVTVNGSQMQINLPDAVTVEAR